MMAVALVGRRNASAASSAMIGYGGVTEDAAGMVLSREKVAFERGGAFRVF